MHAILWTALLATAAPQDAALPPDLAQAAADYDQAQMHNDGAALQRLLADDYTLVNGAAEISTKAEFIRDSTAPGFSLQPFVIEHPINRVWRDGAVLSGEVTLRGTDGGKPFVSHMRFADIWAKRGGRWQVVFTEVTRFPAAAQP
ncbi:nuclear transport factor 2 family protein [Sphingomonas sp. MMSM20]|uniref:nuclear transport factor 2 family protein n=1 Tax=Sphingomonas lycopersici TaxID=2951807 RepID=UPI0022386E29|nr:nuclear transport factor 2 family protein [Sphingomonas lycopersici]MCW6530415.1 nuclear transport factor 2 family protein [Sphingomonas lycopersici]